MMLLPLLPRCWHLAAGIPARNWLLTGGGGFAGQEAWSGTCQLLPRLLWTSPGSRSPDPSQPTEPRPETKETLKEWALAVCPFGSLKAHLPCHVTLCPLDPHKHPNGDRIFVTAKAASTKTCHPRSGLDSLKVKYDEGLKEVSIISSDVDGAASVDVRMPVKFGMCRKRKEFLPARAWLKEIRGTLRISQRDRPLLQQGLSERRGACRGFSSAGPLLEGALSTSEGLAEGDPRHSQPFSDGQALAPAGPVPLRGKECAIQMILNRNKRGEWENKKMNSLNIFTFSFQSQKLDIQAKGGKVICLGTIQGNTDIHVTQESTVSIEKLQGSSVNISTTNGLIKTKYLYAESSFLSSAAGDILLGNIHGDTTLQTKTGNITVDSADGSLKASTIQGEIDVYVVSRLGDVELKSENGAVSVKVPATLNADLHLSGSKVEVSPEIHWQDIQKVSREGRIIVTGHMNQKDEKGKHIKAETENGTVNLKSQTWFQSVKLKTVR
nr:PREDICTED: protein FAM185A [Anolis carolinensis]|eukprot:XP_016849669.1 PREDICTED: protein FAM185A [Anolis carolinensis]